MNYQFLGNSYSLMNYDITIQLCNSLSIRLWYVPMYTPPRSRNKDDSNMTNYRLGSQNTELFELMKSLYSKGEPLITDISDFMRKDGINEKIITTEDNKKAGYYRVGNFPYFTQKDRAHYFEGVCNLIEHPGQQVIFLDPDAGIAPINQDVPMARASSLVLLSEINRILNKVTDDSIIVIRQTMNNHFYKQEARIKDLQKELHCNVILLVDEVIQSGLFIITKTDEVSKVIIDRLQSYLSGYKNLKKSDRILLIEGYGYGDSVVKS